MTAPELRKAEAAYRAAYRRAEVKRDERNRMVWKALDEGMTHAAIAYAMGVTRGRVNQIAQMERP